MDASQGSHRSFEFKMLLKDTMGPTAFENRAFDDLDGNDDDGNDVSAENSSTSLASSSKVELSAADEQAARTTFREQNPDTFTSPYQSGRGFGSTLTSTTMSRTDAEDNLRNTRGYDQNHSSFRNPYEMDTGISDTMTRPILSRSVQGDIARDTPESTASSSKRFFLGNSDKLPRVLDTANLTSAPGTQLGKTMRGVFRVETGTTGNGINPEVLENTKEKDTIYSHAPGEDSKGVHCAPRFFLMLLVVLGLIAGLVVLIYYKREHEPDKPMGTIVKETEVDECPVVNVKLREQIQISCLFKKNINPNLLSSIRISPPVYVNEGQPFIVKVTTEDSNSTWSASFQRNRLLMRGPIATCIADGRYNMTLLNVRNMSLYDAKVQLNVISEVLKVNVSLTQNVTDPDSNSTHFRIGCSTNSGCEQSFVDFFADIKKEERHLRGVNFTCTVTYNDYDGYSVSCIGKIPDYLMAQFGRITCRPRSRLLDELDKTDLKELEEVLELPECDLSKHCNYKCKDTGDYFVVNSGRCDIFHRCYQQEVYTSYCAPGTFFDPDPTQCSCRHTKDLAWCQSNGALKPNSDVSDKICNTGV